MELHKYKDIGFFAGHLIKDERILAWTNHAGGKVAVTNFAFLSFDHHENLRLPWEFSLAAKWNEPVLQITSQINFDEDPLPRVWKLVEPGKVPETVRERITNAQVFDQIKEISGVGKVRFVARNGRSGISWTTIAEEKIDFNSQNLINLELAEIRSTLGI